MAIQYEKINMQINHRWSRDNTIIPNMYSKVSEMVHYYVVYAKLVVFAYMYMYVCACVNNVYHYAYACMWHMIGECVNFETTVSCYIHKKDNGKQ